ncbi:MAG: single-stranded DNA-binding protein, partial [Marinovum sp.]|nr:single-stranded DNA-binding protein [Marinovum sp.]
MDFESLKNSQSNFDKISKQIESNLNPEDNEKSKNKYQDDRLWKPELDKTGNGYAVLRFLPATRTEEMPWARVWSHAFQGPGGWYIENSLTTLGQKDPVSEENTILWNTGVDSDKEIARKRKRKLSYYSNIYVVSDPKHPENEGKVFLFKFGKKIFDKITEAMNPAFEDEKPINPFDFWSGANFKLKIRKVDGYWNYDKSEFEATSKLSEDESKVEEICQKSYALSEFTNSSNFKSYEELAKRMDIVLSGTTKVGNVQESLENEVKSPDSNPQKEAKSAPQVKAQDVVGSNDDDTMSY